MREARTPALLRSAICSGVGFSVIGVEVVPPGPIRTNVPPPVDIVPPATPVGDSEWSPLNPVVDWKFIGDEDESERQYLSGISSCSSTSVLSWKLPALRVI